jgi:hypothetical protein
VIVEGEGDIGLGRVNLYPIYPCSYPDTGTYVQIFIDDPSNMGHIHPMGTLYLYYITILYILNIRIEASRAFKPDITIIMYVYYILNIRNKTMVVLGEILFYLGYLFYMIYLVYPNSIYLNTLKINILLIKI